MNPSLLLPLEGPLHPGVVVLFVYHDCGPALVCWDSDNVWVIFEDTKSAALSVGHVGLRWLGPPQYFSYSSP